MAHLYLIALGSNVRHHRHGSPRGVVRAALDELPSEGLRVERASPVLATAPLGPSLRRYANAVALVSSDSEPEEVLASLKRIETRFGRKRGGRRWGARVLDMDIVLWDGGPWASEELVVPHPDFRERDFVLRPALSIACGWRDPISGLSIRHLFARLTKARPVPR